MLKIIIVVVFLLASVYSDYKTVKIRNSITLPFVAIGLIINVVDGSILESLIGLVFPFVFFFIFWRMKLIGAGDIKVFMGMGAVLGVRIFINTLFPIFVVLFIMWLFVTKFSFDVIGQRFKYMHASLKIMFLTKSVSKENKLEIDADHIIKMSYGILIGFLVSVVMNYFQVGLIFTNLNY